MNEREILEALRLYQQDAFEAMAHTVQANTKALQETTAQMNDLLEKYLPKPGVRMRAKKATPDDNDSKSAAKGGNRPDGG